MTEKRKVEIIGAPVGIASGSIGASLGPDSIRLAGLHESLARLKRPYADNGNVTTPLEEPYPPKDYQSGQIRYLDEILNFQSELHDVVTKAYNRGSMPLVLGGDHSVAIGSISASIKYFNKQGVAPGVIWFDAHADLNTEETSPSGNIHGMPLAIALGKGSASLCKLFEGNFLSPGRTVIIGVRSVDSEEADIIRELGVRIFTMKDIDEMGAANCYRRALRIASPKGEPIHLSFDIDGVDERFVPGTGTPVSGGTTIREAHLLLEMIAESGVLAAMDMVEVNPLLDHCNSTAKLALELIQSALGKVIY